MAQSLQTEQDTAIEAVRLASQACQSVQRKLVSADTLEKKDRSPVTVADYASQAIVCAALIEAFPDDPVIGEEDAAELRTDDHAAIRQAVVQHVAAVWDSTVNEEQVLDWIDHGVTDVTDGSPSRFWTLDPIDGTKGFLRNEQYAVALALVEGGQVVLGVLGCPNLTIGDGDSGAMLVAARGQGTQVMPLWDASAQGHQAAVSSVSDASQARFCESVESAHSDQSSSAQIASILGITTDPIRMDSQAKYAALARGDASIYLRLPTRADYQEKIWDHGAGSIVIEEAGGRVTDITGKPLDFTRGRTLAVNQGIIATNSLIHDRVVEAVQQVLGA